MPPLRTATAAAAAILAAACTSSRPGVPPPPLVLLAGGDVMFDRAVGQDLARNGPEYSLAGISGDGRAADLFFVNLESPLATTAKLEKPIAFRADPRAAVSLAAAGVDVVSLANNHAVDSGRDGLRETMDNLKKSGIRWCGAGTDRAAADTPLIRSVRGVRVAFTAFTEFPEGSRKRDNVPTMSLADEETVRRVVSAAVRKADVVVASFHWGEEYRDAPGPSQVRLARVAADAGADLILGHHPHVPQGLAILPSGRAGRPRRSLVAYSLGNLLFDQRHPWTNRGFLLRCRLDRDGVRDAALAPLRSSGRKPRPAAGDELPQDLRRLAGLSADGIVSLPGGIATVNGSAPPPVR